MDEQSVNRRRILSGMAMAAGAAGLGGLGTRNARGADAPPTPDAGTSQAPTITDVKDKVVYITGGSSGHGHAGKNPSTVDRLFVHVSPVRPQAVIR